MLKKLIRHEFRATSKSMWSIIAGMVLLTILTRFGAIPMLKWNKNFLTNAIALIILFLFGVGVTALSLAPLIVSAQRFKTGVLGKEGYLTMALPVSSHQLIGSRLITDAVWYALSGVVLILIGVGMIANFEDIPILFRGFGGMLAVLKTAMREHPGAVGNCVIIVFEILIDIVAGVSLLSLLVYAAYAIGFSASRRKSLWTVLLIYGFFHVVFWAGIGSLFIFGREDMRYGDFSAGMKAFEGFLAGEFLVMFLLSLVFYFITNYFITKKLNLE